MWTCSRRTGAALGLAAVAFIVGPLSASAQPQGTDAAAVLFDDSKVEDLRLWVNERDWRALTDNYLEDTYYPADLVLKGQVVHNIGIRSRGSGSRNPHKPGLKLDFNRYVSGQQPFGLSTVVLDNLYQDPAMVRERVAMKFYAHLGLAAPRETYVKVWINDRLYLGLYALTESMDKRFLTRSGLDRDGYLYDYEYQEAWWFTHLGDDLGRYARRFEPETNKSAAMPVHYGPIEQLIRAANATAGDEAARLDERLDVKLFLRALAVEAFLAEWDGLVGDFGMNNFYLYRPSASERFVVLPWDKDNTFKAIDYPIWPDGMDTHVLTARLLRNDDLRRYFLDTLLECAAVAEAPVASLAGAPSRSWLEQEIVAHYELIADAAQADTRKVHSNSRFLDEVELLRRFARERPGFVRGAVARRY